MTEEIKDWRDVCRKLLELDEQGYKEPWREFEVCFEMTWITAPCASQVIYKAENNPRRVRLKPRTVKVTTHSGEVLELPEPWWNVPGGHRFYCVLGGGEVTDRKHDHTAVSYQYIGTGNAFRTREDAQAWADAMPLIKGGKRHD